MRFVSLLTIPVLALAGGCSSSSNPGPSNDETPDGSMPDTSTPDASPPDTSVPETSLPDGQPADARPDVAACSNDAAPGACCCDGDVVGFVQCSASGLLSCDLGYRLYYGLDCNTFCVPGHDSGTPADASDAGDAGDARGHRSVVPEWANAGRRGQRGMEGPTRGVLEIRRDAEPHRGTMACSSARRCDS
jgi:hypothetical protein